MSESQPATTPAAIGVLPEDVEDLAHAAGLPDLWPVTMTTSLARALGSLVAAPFLACLERRWPGPLRHPGEH